MPTVFAWSTGLAEFVSGDLLTFGLFTKMSSFFIAFTMVVAFLSRMPIGILPSRKKVYSICLLHYCFYSKVRAIGEMIIGSGSRIKL
jgi:hypothetical protein